MPATPSDAPPAPSPTPQQPTLPQVAADNEVAPPLLGQSALYNLLNEQYDGNPLVADPDFLLIVDCRPHEAYGVRAAACGASGRA